MLLQEVKVKVKKWLCLSLLCVSSFLLLGEEQTKAATNGSSNPVDCSIPADQISFYDNDTNFKEYLQSINVPYQIKVGGKTLTANRYYALNRCMLVYGGPFDVPSSEQDTQYVNGVRQFRYLGYSVNKSLYPDPLFPDLVGPNQDRYVKERPFLIYPWNNRDVIEAANSNFSDTPYPVAPNTSEEVRREELSKAVDRFCYARLSCRNTYGWRGYFDQLNTELNVVLNPQNLSKYASIHSFSSDYVVGNFSLYYKSENNGRIYYATFYTPAKKRLFEEIDLILQPYFEITPTPGMDNDKINQIKFKVKNQGIRHLKDVEVYYGFQNGKTYCTTIDLKPNEVKTVVVTKGQLDCKNPSKSEDLTYPYTSREREKIVPFTVHVNPKEDNPKDETTFTNNKRDFNVTVRNPNAFVTIQIKNRNEAVVTVINNTFNTITSPSGNQKFSIQVFDTKWEKDPNKHVLLQGYSQYPSFTLQPLESKSFTVTLPQRSKTKGDQYKIVATIPNYKGEYTYVDNVDEDFITLSSSIPIPTECNTINVPYVGKLNKMCSGHYPKYPSTVVENGMQTYHYVLYRFFPQPIPQYNVSKLDGLTEVYDLKENQGQTFLFSKDGKQRGRMMPRGVNLSFTVYYEQSNGSSIPVAKGTVTYNIPESCYDPNELDLIHKTNCDEILIFLPNDSDTMFEKPQDYPEGLDIDIVNNPITNTKIPFVNPGNYRFELKAQESFQMRVQTFENGKWSKPVWKSN